MRNLFWRSLGGCVACFVLAGCEGAPLWAPIGSAAQGSSGGNACEEAADIAESCAEPETVQCGSPETDVFWECVLDAGLDPCDIAAGTLSDSELNTLVACSELATD